MGDRRAMKKPLFYCDKCLLTISEAEAYHHKDWGHTVVALDKTEEEFETAEKEAEL